MDDLGKAMGEASWSHMCVSFGCVPDCVLIIRCKSVAMFFLLSFRAISRGTGMQQFLCDSDEITRRVPVLLKEYKNTSSELQGWEGGYKAMRSTVVCGDMAA